MGRSYLAARSEAGASGEVAAIGEAKATGRRARRIENFILSFFLVSAVIGTVSVVISGTVEDCRHMI